MGMVRKEQKAGHQGILFPHSHMNKQVSVIKFCELFNKIFKAAMRHQDSVEKCFPHYLHTFA